MELRVTKQNTEKVTSRKAAEKRSQKSNIHKDHRSRLKNQFIEYGIDALTDIQKLEMLLFFAIPQKDTNPIAHNLLNEFGSLSNVMSASFSELIKVDGVKENSATLLRFFGSMVNYTGKADADPLITSSSKAKDFVTKHFNHISVEQFYVFCLSKSNAVKKSFLINTGTTSEVNIEIRNITEKALETNCNRIIVAHNHPLGKAIMSAQDCRFTYSLLCSCFLNNIELIDHIIVGTDKTISLYEQGILSKLKEKAVDKIQIKDPNKLFISEQESNYIKSMVDNSFDPNINF